jgi:hypothetical protein
MREDGNDNFHQIDGSTSGMKKHRRGRPSLKIQLETALYQLGLDPKNVRLDHWLPLSFREYDFGTEKYIPDEHDPRYMQWLSTADHAEKTNGPRGDIVQAAKLKRMAKKEAAFHVRLLAKDAGESIIPSRKWPRRKFPKREAT